MAHSNKPILGPSIDEEIETARYEIHKQYWPRFKALAESQNEQLIRAFDPTASPPRPKRPRYLCELLRSYANELFEIEAKHYPDDPARDEWLTNLAVRVATNVEEHVGPFGLEYHAPRLEMRQSIREALKQEVGEFPPPTPREQSLPSGSSEATTEKKSKRRTTRTRRPKTEALGAEINGLREECRFSCEELAELVELDPTSVFRHISGKSVPRLKNIAAYERVFSKKLERKVVIEITPVKRQ